MEPQRLRDRSTPNPSSRLLAHAVIGGSGIALPSEIEVPEGMGAIVLYVPIEDILGKNPLDVQTDLGMPWHVINGEPLWFDEV